MGGACGPGLALGTRGETTANCGPDCASCGPDCAICGPDVEGVVGLPCCVDAKVCMPQPGDSCITGGCVPWTPGWSPPPAPPDDGVRSYRNEHMYTSSTEHSHKQTSSRQQCTLVNVHFVSTDELMITMEREV